MLTVNMVAYAYICVGESPHTEEAGAEGFRFWKQPKLGNKILSQRGGHLQIINKMWKQLAWCPARRKSSVSRCYYQSKSTNAGLVFGGNKRFEDKEVG